MPVGKREHKTGRGNLPQDSFVAHYAYGENTMNTYEETTLPGTPLGSDPVEGECDNCAADGKKSQPAVTLADGMKLCADCAKELRDMFEE